MLYNFSEHRYNEHLFSKKVAEMGVSNRLENLNENAFNLKRYGKY